MPSFSRTSKDKLATCHPDLQRLFNEVIKHVDCTVLEGSRTRDTQNEYYRSGKSKLKGGDPRAKHCYSPSRAVDVIMYPIKWDDWKRHHHFVGFVRGVANQMGIDIRCGIDWDNDFDFEDQSLHDAPHFELRD